MIYIYDAIQHIEKYFKAIFKRKERLINLWYFQRVKQCYFTALISKRLLQRKMLHRYLKKFLESHKI